MYVKLPEQNHRFVAILLLFSILFLLAPRVGAEAAKSDEKEKQTCSESPDLEEILPADQLSVTDHMLQSGDIKLPYQATAGTLPVKLDRDGTECRIFFISYHSQTKKQSTRPLTFVFNGGPGASSAYLHLGVLGPERVIFNEDGSMPPPPARLGDNRETWLRFTDLVFVDPPGTGYSRCQKIEDSKKQPKSEAQAWDVKEDLAALSKFIRLYLTRYNRWLSPRYLVGESYGGFRVAALSDFLQTDYEISLNGVILVSPALEFELLYGNELNLLPWVVSLPSYAATARHHGRAAGPPATGMNTRQALEEVEQFAVREFLPALAAADTEPLNSRIAELIGLPAWQVAQHNARISRQLFAKELLRDEGLLVSVYDGSITSIDPDPSSPWSRRPDTLLVQLNTLLAATFNSFIREQLKFETDIPYEILNSDVSKSWNWRSGMDAQQGFAGVAENLKNSMSVNKDLKVLIAHGFYDLVTPYFGSVIVTRQMQLNQAIAANLSLEVYEGGHMFYTNDVSRKRFFEDAERFYTTPTAPAVQ